MLEEGTVLAIEPMVNAGGALVRMGDDGWAVYSQDGSLAAHFEFTVAVTADGPNPDPLARRRVALRRAASVSACAADARDREPQVDEFVGATITPTTMSPPAVERARPGCRRSRSRRRRGSSQPAGGSIGARTALEFGTLGGYSSIWIGRALPRAAASSRGRPRLRRGRREHRRGRARRRRDAGRSGARVACRCSSRGSGPSTCFHRRRQGQYARVLRLGVDRSGPAG